MTTQPTSTLGFNRAPVVNEKGVASRDFRKWLEKIEAKTNNALSVLGINPNSVIIGRGGTLGTALQHISPVGAVTAPGVGFAIGDVPGQLGPGAVGFTEDNVPDGLTRFCIKNGAGLNGVAFIDANKRALIDFAAAGHLNEILDNIADGVKYQRFTRVSTGTAALATGSIASGSSATTSVSAPGVLPSDTIQWSLNAAPAFGYAAAATGSLYILAYVSTATVNFYVGNPTTGAIIPGAQTLNWAVVR